MRGVPYWLLPQQWVVCGLHCAVSDLLLVVSVFCMLDRVLFVWHQLQPMWVELHCVFVSQRVLFLLDWVLPQHD